MGLGRAFASSEVRGQRSKRERGWKFYELKRGRFYECKWMFVECSVGWFYASIYPYSDACVYAYVYLYLSLCITIFCLTTYLCVYVCVSVRVFVCMCHYYQ